MHVGYSKDDAETKEKSPARFYRTLVLVVCQTLVLVVGRPLMLVVGQTLVPLQPSAQNAVIRHETVLQILCTDLHSD